MNRRPHRVVNERSAVRSIIYPAVALEVRTPEMAKNEIMEVLPKRKIPGTALLKKMAKDREKAKLKKEAERVVTVLIDPEAVEEALEKILEDLES
jgi:hypothetical protein